MFICHILTTSASEADVMCTNGACSSLVCRSKSALTLSYVQKNIAAECCGWSFMGGMQIQENVETTTYLTVHFQLQPVPVHYKCREILLIAKIRVRFVIVFSPCQLETEQCPRPNRLRRRPKRIWHSAVVINSIKMYGLCVVFLRIVMTCIHSWINLNRRFEPFSFSKSGPNPNYIIIDQIKQKQNYFISTCAAMLGTCILRHRHNTADFSPCMIHEDITSDARFNFEKKMLVFLK